MLRKQNECGFTLVELVIAVALVTGVMACLYYFFAFSMRSYHFVEDHYQAELSAKNIVRTVSRHVRKANQAVIGGTAHKAVEIQDSGMTMNVYTDIDNDTVLELVKYKVTGGKLMMGTAELGNTPASYSELADKIYNQSALPVVAAFKANGKKITINLLIKDATSSLKDDPVSVSTCITIRSKGAMD